MEGENSMTRMEGVRANAQWLLLAPAGSSEERQLARMIKARLNRMVLDPEDTDENLAAWNALLSDPTPWDRGILGGCDEYDGFAD